MFHNLCKVDLEKRAKSFVKYITERHQNVDDRGLNELESLKVDVLINCSPVGMTPNVDQTPYPAELLKPGMIVFDSVYNPLETRLIREARYAGCTTIPGVELFVNQAAEQFELWTGKPAPIAAMRNVVIEKLKNQSICEN